MNLRDEERQEEHYTFTRVGKNSILRICTASLREGEHLYIRTLLLHVCSLISFADFRTVEVELYPTDSKACLNQGLLLQDLE